MVNLSSELEHRLTRNWHISNIKMGWINTFVKGECTFYHMILWLRWPIASQRLRHFSRHGPISWQSLAIGFWCWKRCSNSTSRALAKNEQNNQIHMRFLMIKKNNIFIKELTFLTKLSSVFCWGFFWIELWLLPWRAVSSWKKGIGK